MAFDGAFLSCLRAELQDTLRDARIDKIHQPSGQELVLSLRRRNGAEKLYISARANSPRIHFTAVPLENPAQPPMFCMLLRKRMTGGRLAAIRQPGLERALYLDFDCVNELGDIVRLTLAVEIMGRHSNIILVENGQVVDAIKRVDWDMSSVRPVLPGLPYSPPPAAPGRLDLSQEEPAAFVTAVEKGKDDPLSKALLAVSHGLSPLLCREMAHLATRGQDTRAASLTAEDKQRLAFHLARLKAAVLGGENRKPYLLLHPDGAPLDFSFIPITQYGLSAVGREMASFSALLDAFYAQKDGVERMKQRSHDLLRVLTNAYERTSRKLAHQRQELEQSENREERRIFGDLINANLYAIEKGAPFRRSRQLLRPGLRHSAGTPRPPPCRRRRTPKSIIRSIVRPKQRKGFSPNKSPVARKNCGISTPSLMPCPALPPSGKSGNCGRNWRRAATSACKKAGRSLPPLWVPWSFAPTTASPSWWAATTSRTTASP